MLRHHFIFVTIYRFKKRRALSVAHQFHFARLCQFGVAAKGGVGAKIKTQQLTMQKQFCSILESVNLGASHFR